MVAPLNTGPHYRPPNIIIPIMGIPKKVPLILGHPHMGILNSALGLCSLTKGVGLLAQDKPPENLDPKS